MSRENIWHALSIEELFKKLKTSAHGLTVAEAEKRLREYGPNELEEERRITKLALLIHQLKNPLVGVLLAAAFISLLVGKMIDAVVVAVVIAINTSIGFIQEYKAEAALHALKSLAAPEAEVLRNCPEKGACIEMRVKAREIVLGMGGVRILDALGYKIRKYHMNEGHSSFLALELLRKHEMNINKVRNLCIFTTHTPVEAGHDKFSYDLVREVSGEFIPLNILQSLGGQDRLNMTLLALNLSNYVNGVAKRHKMVSKEMFPSYEIHAITNGIHSYTWTCESFKRLYDRYLPGWAHEPELLVRVGIIPDDEIWQAHLEAKKNLINYVNSATNIDMDYDTLTMGFARTATE